MTCFFSRRSKPTRLEDLSNELFYEIFPQLDGFDLYEAFADLNTRFDCLLDDKVLRMNVYPLATVEPTREARFLALVLRHRSRIISLALNCELLLDSSFIALESLKLSLIQSDVLESIVSSLIFLPRLFALTIEQNDNETHLCQIYPLIFCLPVLKRLRVSLNVLRTFSPLPMAPSDGCSPIEHLLIDHPCTFSDLMNLLSFVPQLKRLTCRELCQSPLTTVGNVSVSLPCLERLYIHQRDLPFRRLETLLPRLSSALQVLRISGRCEGDDYLNVERWEHLFTQNLAHLKKFLLHLNINLVESSYLNVYSIILKQFKTPFWIERPWVFAAKIQWSYRECYGINYTIASNRYAEESFRDRFFNSIVDLENESVIKANWSDLLAVPLMRMIGNYEELLSSLLIKRAVL